MRDETKVPKISVGDKVELPGGEVKSVIEITRTEGIEAFRLSTPGCVMSDPTKDEVIMLNGDGSRVVFLPRLESDAHTLHGYPPPTEEQERFIFRTLTRPPDAE